jgi:glycosyltransferase involved in cell wall biosynthesis
MRVLFVHQNFVDYEHPGGTRHLELAAGLVRRGHQATILASDVDFLTGTRIPIPTRHRRCEWIDGVRIVRAHALATVQKSHLWRAMSYFAFMATALRVGLRLGRVDVVIGTTPPVSQLSTAWLLSLASRVPLVVEIRDLWMAAVATGVPRSRVVNWTAMVAERFFCRVARHVVVNAPAYREYLVVQHGVPADGITVVPNGVDPQMFDPRQDGRQLRCQLGVDDRFVATYAGALGTANDLATILRAAQRLVPDRRIHFLFVGDGQQKPRLRALADQLQLHNVTFAGSFPKQRMAEVLAASDVCLATLMDIPAFRMNYPNKVFDYMAAGRPTVLAIDGAIRQVVESAGGGVFVPPGDDRALAEAVKRLSEDPEKARAMGVAARNYVVQYFDRRQQADTLERLLLRIAPSPVAN